MCGEKGPEEMARYLMGGSPPHVRGKGSTNGGSSWSQRITPACAGKRVEFYAERHKDQDHPRMCGEKTDAQYQLPIMQGSPPHVRGKVGLRLIAAQDDGITPACAGKSEPPGSGLGASGDHPRMCGEKTKPQRVAPPKLGSPPRMRGKEHYRVARKVQSRITPAYAGKRTERASQLPGAQDHPRVCGEKRCPAQMTSCGPGSPPRMRGKALVSGESIKISGITPAYAGKRLKRFRSTVSPVAIVPLFPSVCNKPVVSDGSPAGRDAPLFLPAENAVPASPAYNLRSL